MDDKTVIFATLPNGDTFLSATRFHAGHALKGLGFQQKMPHAIWEAAMNHGATVHWSGVVLRRVLHPAFTNSLDTYTIVDPFIVACSQGMTSNGGYAVGAPHPSVAKNYAEVVADLEQNW